MTLTNMIIEDKIKKERCKLQKGEGICQVNEDFSSVVKKRFRIIKNDVELLGLNGGVKSIRTMEYYGTVKNGRVIPVYPMFHFTLFYSTPSEVCMNFDQDGNALIRSESMPELFFDKNRRIVKALFRKNHKIDFLWSEAGVIQELRESITTMAGEKEILHRYVDDELVEVIEFINKGVVKSEKYFYEAVAPYRTEKKMVDSEGKVHILQVIKKDHHGRLVEKQNLESGDTSFYRDGKMVAELEKAKEFSLRHYYEYSSDTIVETLYYEEPDMKPTKSMQLTFNKDWLELETLTFDESGRICDKTETIYDEHSNWIEWVNFKMMHKGSNSHRITIRDINYW